MRNFLILLAVLGMKFLSLSVHAAENLSLYIYDQGHEKEYFYIFCKDESENGFLALLTDRNQRFSYGSSYYKNSTCWTESQEKIDAKVVCQIGGRKSYPKGTGLLEVNLITLEATFTNNITRKVVETRCEGFNTVRNIE